MSEYPDVPESIFRTPMRVDQSPRVRAPSHQPRHARIIPRKPSFWPTIGWTALGTLVPGVGLWRGGRRVAGPIVTGVFVVLVGALTTLWFGARDDVIGFATQSSNLLMVAIAVLTLGLAWVVVIGVSHFALRAPHPTTGQRAAGAVVVGLLSLAVMAPAALGADIAYTVATAINGIFEEDPPGEPVGPDIPVVAVDPWENIPRINVMLLGGDHDKGRSESKGSRTDAVVVASINTKTGATTLISIPRQTGHMPFPKDSKLNRYFPNGWYDGRSGTNPDYFLNAMHLLPRMVPAGTLGKYGYIEAVKLSVGEALGLKIDYFAMLDMDGFKDFINAIGGITVNVNQRLPIGGVTGKRKPITRANGWTLPAGWIEPGPNQHMSGYRALWYARGRFNLDDYNRQARQRCAINAVVRKINPANILQKYNAVAKAANESIMTDIPQKALPAMLTLAERVKGATMRSVGFVNGKDGFVSSNPNFALMRTQVKTALKDTDAANTPAATPSPGSTTPGSSTPGSSTPPKKGTQSVDTADACAYRPIPAKDDPNQGIGISPPKR